MGVRRITDIKNTICALSKKTLLTKNTQTHSDSSAEINSPLPNNPSYWQVQNGVNADAFDDIPQNVRPYLDKENIEDFKKVYVQNTGGFFDKNGNLLYINPTSGFFDIEIYNLAQELDKNTPCLSYSNYSNEDYSKIAQTLVNKKDGKINDEAVQFLKDFTFQTIPDTVGSNCKHPKLNGNINYLNVIDILNSLKDNQGNFDSTNIEFMSKMLVAFNKIRYTFPFAQYFDLTKDENGITNKRMFKYAIKSPDVDTSSWIALEDLKAHKKYSQSYLRKFKSTLCKAFNTQKISKVAFLDGLNFCHDENGNLIEQNLNYLTRTAKKLNIDINGNHIFFISDMPEDEKSQKLTSNLVAKNLVMDISNYNEVLSLIKKYSNKDKELNFDIEEKIELFANAVPEYYSDWIIDLNNVISMCDINGSFDEALFNKVVDTLKNNYTYYKFLYANHTKPDYIKGFLNHDIDVSKLDFYKKNQIMDLLVKLSQEEINDIDKKEFDYLKGLLKELQCNLEYKNPEIYVSEEYKKDFLHDVLSVAKKDENGYTAFENTIKNSIPELKQMKKGIPLKYSKENFLSDVNNLIQNDNDKNKFQKLASIDLITDTNAKIIGYDGIMTLKNFNANTLFEKKSYELCHKFLYENEVQTGNNKLDEQLNKIIRGCPEFINTIGKKQHSTHDYTLDIHQLLVLANSINNPEYKNLNDINKALLKMTCILHDISKRQNIIDTEHPDTSAAYGAAIAGRYFKNPVYNDRIVELIKNHHWLKEYNTASNKQQTANKLAFRFRHPYDFDIAKILAKADLMAVSDSFYNKHKNALKEDNLSEIYESLDFIYQNGNAVFSDFIVNKDAANKHKSEYNNKQYTVLDLHKCSEDDSIAKYGFHTQTAKKDARFLVHMIPEGEIKKTLKKVKQLSFPENEGVLSEALITPFYNRTYSDRKYGLIFQQENINVINMSKSNQGSGRNKGYDTAMRLIFDDELERQNFRRGLLKNLNIEQSDVTDKQYADFYKKHLASKTSLSQIADSKIYTLNKKSFTGKELKKAISDFQDSLIDVSQKKHNEIVGYLPKISALIAKTKSLDEIPAEFLDFAYENDFPIVLI